MRSVFNLGIGYIAVVEQASVDAALAALERGGCPGWVAGEVTASAGVELH